MKGLLLPFSFWLTACQQVYALDVQEQIDKAKIEYIEYDDASSAVRRLAAILEQDPEHLEANWLYLLYTKLDLVNTSLEGRIDNLRDAAPEIEKIVALAKQQGNDAFGHYVLAEYAADHHAFDRALTEIEQALKLGPVVIRYTRAKAKIMISKGDWDKNNDLIFAGIEILKQLNDGIGKQRPVDFTVWRYHFDVAYAYGDLTHGESCPREAIDHYLAVVNTSPYKNKLVAYAWNNMSCGYRKLGECDKAKEASEQALEIMDFGAARTNLRYSEYCLQMQKMDIYAKP